MEKPETPGETKPRAPRALSSIEFPYVDLDDAISVASAILKQGAQPMSRDQIAAAMNQQPASGNFSVKLSAARMFGLIENVQGKNQLTQLGFSVLDSDENRVKAAKAEAFQRVALYRRTYEDFRGKQLPPRPHGLEQAFVQYGVAPKQKDKARMTFERSAQQAGYFINGPDRLVEPVVLPPTGKSESHSSAMLNQKSDSGGANQNETPAERHRLIDGLLDTLPKIGQWDMAGRAKWLRAAADIFDLLYETKAGGGKIEIKATNEKESDQQNK